MLPSRPTGTRIAAPLDWVCVSPKADARDLLHRRRAPDRGGSTAARPQLCIEVWTAKLRDFPTLEAEVQAVRSLLDHRMLNGPAG